MIRIVNKGREPGERRGRGPLHGIPRDGGLER
jgi:hypothetical protein